MLIFGLIDLPIWLVIILTLVISFYIYTERKHGIFKRYGIPGPKPAPFIGGFPALAKKGLMISEYEGTLKYGKCFGFFLGNLPTVLTTDTEIIKEIFVKRFTSFPNRTQSAYVTSFWQRTILMSNKLEHWKFLRHTLTPTFTSGKLKKMDGQLMDCIEYMIGLLQDQSSDGKVVDVVPILRGLSLDIICRTALGVEANTQSDKENEFVKQVSKMLNFSIEKNPLLTLLFLIPDIKHICRIFDIDYNDTKSIAYLAKSIKGVIDERKKDDSGNKVDLLQLMINSHKQNENNDNNDSNTAHRGMTDDEIISNALIFLFAGTDTTSTVLIFSSYFLATEQDCQERLTREIDDKIGKDVPTYDSVHLLVYLDMFISEVMRLYPPVTRSNRQMEIEETFNGFKIPKNISLTVPVYTLHRLEEYWPNPFKFDPERFSEENKPKIQPYTYMPFGVGPKMCIGMRFAQMELKLTLVRMLQKFQFKPSPGLQIPPVLQKNVFCRPEGGMPLLLEKREN